MVPAVPVSRSVPAVKAVLRASFPKYTGRKVRVQQWSRPVYIDWNWGGGSRDFVALVRLSDGKVAHADVPAPWSHDHRPLDPADFGDDVLLVVHSIFCGADAGITIYGKVPSLPAIGGGIR